MVPYVTMKPRQYDEGDYSADRQTIVVHDDGDGPVATGLLNAEGVPLYRLPDRVPLGFQAQKPRIRVKAPRG